MLDNYGKKFFGCFYFYLVLVSYIFGALLITLSPSQEEIAILLEKSC